MWLTEDIRYKRVKVYKDTFFGRIVKNGYELTDRLEYAKNNGILFLDKGYVWDGPSFPKFLEFIIGKRNFDSLLAASAFHDTADAIPTIKKDHSVGYYYKTVFDIRESAWLYREMIRGWKDNKITDIQSQLQYIGLLAFHYIYRLLSSQSNWKKYK